MKFEEILKYAASGTVMLAGGLMMLTGIADFNFGAEMVVVSSVGVGVGYTGLRLINRVRNGQYRRLVSLQERYIIQLASVTNGCVTLAEVALKLEMDVEEAKKHLESLQAQGVFSHEVTGNGTLLYSLSS